NPTPRPIRTTRTATRPDEDPVMEQTIELPALHRAAELAPNTIDPETRSVDVIWSTGARVRRLSLFGDPHDEELSMAPDHVRLERLNNGAPFLKVHDAGDLDAV